MKPYEINTMGTPRCCAPCRAGGLWAHWELGAAQHRSLPKTSPVPVAHKSRGCKCCRRLSLTKQGQVVRSISVIGFPCFCNASIYLYGLCGSGKSVCAPSVGQYGSIT